MKALGVRLGKTWNKLVVENISNLAQLSNGKQCNGGERGNNWTGANWQYLNFPIPCSPTLLNPFLDVLKTHGTRLVLLLLTAHCLQPKLLLLLLPRAGSDWRPVSPLDCSVTLTILGLILTTGVPPLALWGWTTKVLLLPRAGSDWRGPRSRGCFCHWSTPPLLTITHQHPTGSRPQWINSDLLLGVGVTPVHYELGT